MRKSLKIVPVSEAEITALRDISEETFIQAFAGANDPVHFKNYIYKAFTLAQISHEWQADGSEFYFAKVGNDIAGYLKLNHGLAQTDHDVPRYLEPELEQTELEQTELEKTGLEMTMEIERIYLRRDYHGQGLGKALMQKSTEIALEAGRNWLWLGVWEENNNAIEFYRHQGFEPFSQHDFYMGDDLQRDLLMKKRLV